MHSGDAIRTVGVTALFAAALLAGCDETREAESETPVAEAEVSTELPESAVSDAQLEAAANVAADMASQPPPAVIAVPAPEGSGQTAQPTENGMQQ